MHREILCTFALMFLSCSLARGQSAAPPDEAESLRRAIAFLAREVPQWPVENRCYSCHNNGDAARALYAVQRAGFALQPETLAATTAWLSQPQKWKHQPGSEDFSDPKLPGIQFASALLEAQQSGAIRDRAVLAGAAKIVAENQDADGAWKIDAAGTVGSPVTYGTVLATVAARRILRQADAQQFQPQIEKAERFLRAKHPQTVLDAAAVLLGLEDASSSEADSQRDECWQVIVRGQGQSGGWGPYVTAPAEPFDTALVLLALAEQKPSDERRARIARGRRYLVESQLADGGWTETTRPAGAESYAQRMSTAGWATLALLRTRPADEAGKK